MRVMGTKPESSARAAIALTYPLRRPSSSDSDISRCHLSGLVFSVYRCINSRLLLEGWTHRSLLPSGLAPCLYLGINQMSFSNLTWLSSEICLPLD